MGTSIAVSNGRAAGQREQAAQELFQIISGFWLSRAVQTAATLGIPDLLAQGPKSTEQLARETATDTDALYRLLRALASFGILQECDGHRFSATLKSDLLRAGVPGSLRAAMVTELGMAHYQSWEKVADSVRTGEPAFDRVFGMGPWQYMEQNPEFAALFNDSMTGLTQAVQHAVMEVYDFSPYRKIVDIGGGQGRLLAGILAGHAYAHGVLFDRAQVIEAARPVVATAPAGRRMELVAGDFFESVPAGGDLYTLKWIVHDWADAEALRILQNVRRAMAPNARVLLLETVIAAPNTPDFSTLMDLNMLVMTGGRERRASEYRDLLAAAGLHLNEIYATKSPVSVIEAIG